MISSNNHDTIAATASDLEILRRFEPVQLYTKGEQFFASDVERYLEKCSLWAHQADGRDELLVPEGELTEERLTAPFHGEPGSFRYLRFVHPLTLADSAQVLNDQTKLRHETGNNFVAGAGRLRTRRPVASPDGCRLCCQPAAPRQGARRRRRRG